MEYRKFMYLAAISDEMVSPSEIIDKVWHEHLVFTKSYEAFCQILGKQIHHIPFTHQKGEFQKFQETKLHTKELYEKEFGKKLSSVWNKHSMFDSLNLKKAKMKLRMKLLLLMGSFILLFFPLSYFLSPWIQSLDDATFLWGFLIARGVLILTMKVLNQSLMSKLMDKFDKDSFFFSLTPEELVYLKTRSLFPSIYTSMLDLSENGLIRENPDKTVELMKRRKTEDLKERQLLNELKKREIIEIKQLLSVLSRRKIFQNISNSMEAFVKFVHKSSSFHRVFLLNSIVYALFLLVGFIRLKLGILQKEPIVFLIILISLFIVVFLIVLSSVSQSGFANSIKKYYQNKVLPQNYYSTNWKWNYYLVGTSILASSLIPFIYNPKAGNSAGYGCSSCGGGSCGSSCGGGCGGCGG